MDRRDYAATNRWWTDINEGHQMALVVMDDVPDWVDSYDSDEEGFWVPFRWEVCCSCNGKGRYVNPSIDRNGLTEEDFAEMGDDFTEGYFGGTYDVTCEECRGQRVSPVFCGDHRTGQLIEKMVAERQAALAEHEAEMRFCYGPNY